VLRRFAHKYPAVGVELEIGVGTSLFKKIEAQELDIVVGGHCDEQTLGRRLWKEPLVWAFSADAKVPDLVSLAFFPEPCPYREAALRALSGSSTRWRVSCTSSSLAGVKAASMAGMAATPLPKHVVGRGLRILGKKEKLPVLPHVEFVVQTNATDTRQSSARLEELMRDLKPSVGS
jgi:DNA-binding transcriptional LysR family regulator